MKAPDKNPTGRDLIGRYPIAPPPVRVAEEPEDERPLGTGEEVKPDSNGLALDPYADDTLFELARARVPRWLLAVVIILVLIVAALALLVALRARG